MEFTAITWKLPRNSKAGPLFPNSKRQEEPVAVPYVWNSASLLVRKISLKLGVFYYGLLTGRTLTDF